MYRSRSNRVQKRCASRELSPPFFPHGDSEGSFRIIIFPIRSEVLPVTLPLCTQACNTPSIYAPGGAGARTQPRALSPPSRVHPHPQSRGVARRSLRHLSPRPIDGRRAFFPRVEKKGGKGERDREAQESARRGREENRRTRVGKRCQRRRAGREGRRKRESSSALPPKPVADQSPYVKRHFLWAPLGRPVCVIKIDLSPLLFFFKRARERGRERDSDSEKKRETQSAIDRTRRMAKRKRERERDSSRCAQRL